MTTIILVSLGAYTALVAGLGFWASRNSQNTAEDYFIHSRSLSWFHLGVTFLATWYSTIAFIGLPGKIFGGGIAVYLAMGGFNIMAALMIWFIGRKFWQLGRMHGHITPGDLLGGHYDSRVIKLITGLISVLGLFPYILIQLVAIGKVVDVATGGAIDYEKAVLLSAAVAAFYVIGGGIRAVVWTDIVQAVLFSAVAILGLYAVFSVVGGLGEGFQAAFDKAPQSFQFKSNELGKPITLLVTWMFGGILLPHLWQRAYMAKSAQALSKTILVYGGFTFFYVAVMMIVPLLALGFMESLADTDKFIPTLYADLIPWALPVLVLATFAAGMSTLDSQLLTLASVFIRDVFVVIMPHKRLDPAQEKRAGRGLILVMILLLVFAALSPVGQGPIIAMASRGIGLTFMLLVPVIGPLFWPRGNRAGALWALIVGVAVQAALEFGLWDVQIPYDFGSPMVAFAAQIPVFVGLSLVFRPRIS